VRKLSTWNWKRSRPRLSTAVTFPSFLVTFVPTPAPIVLSLREDVGYVTEGEPGRLDEGYPGQIVNEHVSDTATLVFSPGGDETKDR